MNEPCRLLCSNTACNQVFVAGWRRYFTWGVWLIRAATPCPKCGNLFARRTEHDKGGIKGWSAQG